MLAGASASGATADKTQPARGLRDFWIIKTDALGQRQWDATMGGSGDDWANTVLVAADGSYLVGGFSGSGVTGERTRPSCGGNDGWVVKLSPGGRVVWDQAVGGSANDAVVRLLQAPGGDLVVGASSESAVSGDKTQPSKCLFDYWLVRLQAPRITGDAQLCGSGQVQLAAPTGAAYHWSTGATSQTIAVGQPGTYSVVVTGSADDTLTLRHRVTAFVPPPVVLSGDTVLCAGRSGQVAVAAAGATGYRWNTGQTTAAIAVGQPATYTVTAFFGSGCSRQVSVRVRVQPALPPLTLGADTVICEGQALALRVAGAPAGGLRYRWSDNSTAPTLQVQQSGQYTVQLTSACKTRTRTRQVRITPCLTLPTIITPNADHLNDCWVVQGLTGDGWELELFSRWGQRVYHTANYHNEWGARAAAGLY